MLQTNLKGPLTLAAIVIGLSLLIGLGGSWFLASKLEAESQLVSNERMTAARASTLGPRIAALKDQEAAAAAYQRVISLLMPNQEQLLEVPRSIEQLARIHGADARFQFLGSPPPGATKPGDSLPFSLTANGTPEALTAYLVDLELKNPNYTISINNVELSMGGPDGSKLTTAGNFYYQ